MSLLENRVWFFLVKDSGSGGGVGSDVVVVMLELIQQLTLIAVEDVSKVISVTLVVSAALW